MSRFYKIVIGPNTGDQAVPGSKLAKAQETQPSGATGNTGATFTNQVNGRNDPGALMIEMDIPVTAFAQPMGAAGFVRIWGVSINQIDQASDFNGAPISVYGGMQKGLPLATADASQAGLLVQGSVFQAFGNWMGVNQTLDLVIQPAAGGTIADPANLSFTWKKGTELGAMIKQTLAQAYPSLNVKLDVQSGLILPADETGYYQTLSQFANYVKQVSQSIKTGDYPGVDIIINGDTFSVYDGSSKKAPIQIAFQDMMGQVTWLGPFQVQFNTIMRADIAVGDTVKFPALAAFQTTTTQQSQSQARVKTTFNGPWTISMVRHVGNSRAADAQSWVSTFQAYSQDAPQDVTDTQGTTGA